MDKNVVPFKSNKVTSSSSSESPTNTSGGGGGSDMEARVARLEADVEHIKNDIHDIKLDLREIRRDMKSDFDAARNRDDNNFRLLFAALIAVALGLAGMMAKGFNWL